MYQRSVENIPELIGEMEGAERREEPGYVSTYSFPNGHSKDGKVPKIDTLFVDFDIEGKRYNPKKDRTKKQDWRIELSELLTRVRMFSRGLIKEGVEDFWRASLSGHKGVHLFLDFPPIDPKEGTFEQFKVGLNDYADAVTKNLDEVSGGINLDGWVDVISADLGRLTRLPNTPHFGVAYTDETRYCVPVSIEELAEIDVERYEELTKEPRPIPDGCKRTPSESAGEKVVQAIRTADVGTETSSLLSTPSSRNAGNVRQYQKESNDKIEVEDLKLLTSDKPFIWEFREREDAFEHGIESRTMELFIILNLINIRKVPIDVIVDFFRPIPGFDETYTRRTVEDVIARDYNLMKMDTLRENAPTFYQN